MRIGFFHSTLPEEGRKVGGVEVFVDRLATSLANAGHDVEVLSLTGGAPNRPYRHRQILRDHPILLRNRFLFLFILPIILNWKILERYDVLHFHGSDWFYFNRRFPTMRTLHGSALWEARTALNWKRKLSQYLIYPLEHLSRRLADVSTAVGVEAASLYRSDGISKLFVPRETFFPGQKTPYPSCVFIGGWGGRKRGAFVADYFQRQVVPRFPEAVLYMACDNVPESNNIVDLRNPGTDRLAEVVRRSWVLLSASTYEGFGIPYLEALISGTCVVTTRNSGAEYVLADGRYGKIVQDVDFGATLVTIIQDTSTRLRFEEAGLLRAQEFSEQIVVEEHLAYYRLAIERFQKKSAAARNAVG